MTSDDVIVKNLPSGKGVRILISDSASDSLAVVEVTRRFNIFSARVGLRGNWHVHQRPMRWMSTGMDAPDVSSEDLQRRKDTIMRRVRGRRDA